MTAEQTAAPHQGAAPGPVATPQVAAGSGLEGSDAATQRYVDAYDAAQYLPRIGLSVAAAEVLTLAWAGDLAADTSGIVRRREGQGRRVRAALVALLASGWYIAVPREGRRGPVTITPDGATAHGWCEMRPDLLHVDERAAYWARVAVHHTGRTSKQTARNRAERLTAVPGGALEKRQMEAERREFEAWAAGLEQRKAEEAERLARLQEQEEAERAARWARFNQETEERQAAEDDRADDGRVMTQHGESEFHMGKGKRRVTVKRINEQIWHATTRGQVYVISKEGTDEWPWVIIAPDNSRIGICSVINDDPYADSVRDTVRAHADAMERGEAWPEFEAPANAVATTTEPAAGEGVEGSDAADEESEGETFEVPAVGEAYSSTSPARAVAVDLNGTKWVAECDRHGPVSMPLNKFGDPVHDVKRAETFATVVEAEDLVRAHLRDHANRAEASVLGWAADGDLFEDETGFVATDVNPTKPDVNAKISKSRVVGLWRAGFLTVHVYGPGVRTFALTDEGRHLYGLWVRARRLGAVEAAEKDGKRTDTKNGKPYRLLSDGEYFDGEVAQHDARAEEIAAQRAEAARIKQAEKDAAEARRITRTAEEESFRDALDSEITAYQATRGAEEVEGLNADAREAIAVLSAGVIAHTVIRHRQHATQARIEDGNDADERRVTRTYNVNMVENFTGSMMDDELSTIPANLTDDTEAAWRPLCSMWDRKYGYHTLDLAKCLQAARALLVARSTADPDAAPSEDIDHQAAAETVTKEPATFVGPCSCGASIERTMYEARPACTHNGETRPGGGLVVAGYTVKPVEGFGKCVTDFHTLDGVKLYECRNTIGRCAMCVAADLGCKTGDLPGYLTEPQTEQATNTDEEDHQAAAGESGEDSDADEIPAEVDSEEAADVIIRHTRADGTSVEFSTRDPKTAGVPEILMRKQWGRRGGSPFKNRTRTLGAWILYHSRDNNADTWTINNLSKAIREELRLNVFRDVNNHIRRSVAEAEADKYERADDRADKYSEWAGKAAGRSEAAYNASHAISEHMTGEPIKVGHHSERAHRKAIERMDNHMRRSIQEQGKARYHADRAAAAEAFEAFRRDPFRTLRRIEGLEADERGYLRWLNGESNNGYTKALMPETVENLTIELDVIREKLAYWREVVADAERQGVKIWRPEDFTKGDFVNSGGVWREVTRVNKKSLTVATLFPRTGIPVIRSADRRCMSGTMLYGTQPHPCKGGGRCTCDTTTMKYDGVTGWASLADIDAMEAAEVETDPADRRECPRCSKHVTKGQRTYSPARGRCSHCGHASGRNFKPQPEAVPVDNDDQAAEAPAEEVDGVAGDQEADSDAPAEEDGAELWVSREFIQTAAPGTDAEVIEWAGAGLLWQRDGDKFAHAGRMVKPSRVLDLIEAGTLYRSADGRVYPVKEVEEPQEKEAAPALVNGKAAGSGEWLDGPALLFVSSENHAPSYLRGLYRMTRRDAIKVCQDPRMRGEHWGMHWTERPGELGKDFRFVTDKGAKVAKLCMELGAEIFRNWPADIADGFPQACPVCFDRDQFDGTTCAKCEETREELPAGRDQAADVAELGAHYGQAARFIEAGPWPGEVVTQTRARFEAHFADVATRWGLDTKTLADLVADRVTLAA